MILSVKKGHAMSYVIYLFACLGLFNRDKCMKHFVMQNN